MDRTYRYGALALAVAAAMVAMPAASASVEPGTPAKDVHVGADNDNAANPFIQPPGLTSRQDMADTDVLFGRGDGDLLIGRLGADVLLGGPGADILAGGPGRDGQGGGNDVMVGDDGDDIGIWSVGDGNDVFAGNDGTDTMLVGRLLTDSTGSPVLEHGGNRVVPKVSLDVAGGLRYQLVPVPPSEDLGVQYLLRVSPAGHPVSTIRLKDVERVVLPGGPGQARIVDLTGMLPVESTVPVTALRGLTGAIVVAPGQGR